METKNLGSFQVSGLCSYRTYEEWKQKWETEKQETQQGSYRTYEKWKLLSSWKVRSTSLVLTVPMRNGNPVRFRAYLTNNSSSYRTYEEWKPQKREPKLKVYPGSYRTYEEWKLSQGYTDDLRITLFLPYLWGMETVYGTSPSDARTSSYRTYEEWKRYKQWPKQRPWSKVLTVPMRNGNACG